jgi:hypothetical protein
MTDNRILDNHVSDNHRSTNCFLLDAAVSQIYDVPMPKEALMAFLSQAKTFEDYMPSIRKVEHVGTGTDSVANYEWHYDIEMPLAPTLPIVIETVYQHQGAVVSHHTLDDDAPNWMKCSMTFEDSPENTANTYLNMSLHIRLRRTSGADLHPLGLLMGEAFMSRQMQNKMEEIANTFVQKSVNALAEQQNGASQ